MFKHAVMARWYRVGFYKDHRKDVWLEYGQIIIYILRFFKNIYQEKFWVLCFQLFFFTYFLLRILILYICIIFILKHMFKSTCINCTSQRFKHICILYIMLLKNNICINYDCFCNKHRNSPICFYQLFLPKAWLEKNRVNKIYSLSRGFVFRHNLLI